MKSIVELAAVCVLSICLFACGGGGGGRSGGPLQELEIADYGGNFAVNQRISSELIATTEFTVNVNGELVWKGYIGRNIEDSNFVDTETVVDDFGRFSGSFDVAEFYQTIWFGLDDLFGPTWDYTGSVGLDGSLEIDLVVTAIRRDGSKTDIHHFFVGQLLRGPESNLADRDYDGVVDSIDNCPALYNPKQIDNDDDGVGAVCGEPPDTSRTGDLDGDEIHGLFDNCPEIYNPTQLDSDGDGRGDECDATPLVDKDGDGIDNIRDNCPNIYNPDQMDSDFNNVGNACEQTALFDSDGDKISDELDNCPDIPNPQQDDADGDGKGDDCDGTPLVDNDGDGVLNAEDNCQGTPNPDQLDSDGDAIGDACDTIAGP